MNKPARNVTTVTERGQTAIPAKLRRRHHVRPGTRLVWESVGEREWRVLIRHDIPDDADPTRMLGFAKRFRQTCTTADWMRELRESEET